MRNTNTQELASRFAIGAISAAIGMAVICIASTSQADSSLRLYARQVDSADLIVGTRREIPIFLQEQRDAEDISVFDPTGVGSTCKGVGVAGLDSISGSISTQQSKILDFIPNEKWIHKWDGHNSIREDRANFGLATFVADFNGLQEVGPAFPVEIDNVGIVGASEVEIGRLVVEIGPVYENRKLLQPHYDSHLTLDFDFRSLAFRCDSDEYHSQNSGTLNDSTFEIRTPVANSSVRRLLTTEGDYAGGYDIIVEGRQLVAGTRVFFGDNEAETVMVDQDSTDPWAGFQRMQVTVPPSARPYSLDQTVDVRFDYPETVRRDGNTFRDAFTYTGAPGPSPVDVNKDGRLTGSDMDRLSLWVSVGLEQYDLNEDGTVDDGDRDHWVKELAGTWYGDSNLDGEFNSTDLVDVFGGNAYENRQVSTGWAGGDWNGDFFFDSGDLVKAFDDGGYEAGIRQAAQFVPEPNLLIPFGIFMLIAIRKR